MTLNEMYPGLAHWQTTLAAHASGFAFFFVMMAGVALGMARLLPGKLKTSTLTQRLDIRLTLLLALLLRLPLLRESFWYDESFTAGLAKLPFSNMLAVVRSDVHPPLWYTLEWLVGRFSTSELALRAISLVAGLVAIVLVKRVVSRLYDAPTGLVAALLAACLPTLIYYSTEARPYMLIICLVLCLLLCIMENKPPHFVLAAVPLLYLHNIAYVYVALLGLTALWTWRRDKMMRLSWIAAGASIAVAGSLWLPIMAQQAADIADGFWLQFSPGMLAHTTLNMTLGWRIDEALILPVAGLWTICLVLGVVWYRPRQWSGLWAVATFAVPGLVALVSFLWKPVYLDRALLSSALLLSVPLAAAVVQRLGFRLVLPLLLIFSGIGMYTQTRTPFREHVASCAGESIYVTSTAVAFLADYYKGDRPLYVWRHANDLNQTLTEDAKVAMGWQQRDTPPEGSVCMLWYDTALSSADEQAYIRHMRNNPDQASARWLAHNTLGDLYALEMIDEHQR